MLELDEGRRIAEALAAPTPAAEGNTVAILGHHGHLTVGGTVDEAVYRFVLFEQCVDSQLRLESTGRPYHVIDHETAAKTRSQVASAYVAQIGFAMLYDEADDWKFKVYSQAQQCALQAVARLAHP